MNSNAAVHSYIDLMSAYEEKIRALHSELTVLLAHLDDDPIEAIHGMRKLTKFIRALLVLDPKSSPAGDLSMKAISATLAPYRDAQVNLFNYNLLLSEHPELALPELARTLNEHPFVIEPVPDPARLRQIEFHLEAFSLEFDPAAKPLDQDGILAGITRAFERARSLFSQLHAGSPMEQVHSGRKRVKKLWYQLRFIFGDQLQGPEHLQSQFDELGKLMGEIHDLDTLQAVARQHVNGEFLQLLSAKRETHLKQALGLGAILFDFEPENFTAQVIREGMFHLQ